MSDQTSKRPGSETRAVPRTGAVVALAGVLIISAATAVLGGFAPSGDVAEGIALGLVASGAVLAATLLVVAALVCLIPLLLWRFPLVRSPLTFGTAGQLRRFLDWFLAGLTVCALAAYVGVTGLIGSWGVSFMGTMLVGLGVLLICIGVGYPRGGPNYDGPEPFVATVTEEFARFAPAQKYGTSILGLALIATGTWMPASALLAAASVGAALLWLLPWMVAVIRASRIEREDRA